MTALRPLIAGNWKMNGLGSTIAQAYEIAMALGATPTRARVAICAPATLVDRLARAVEGSDVIIGGQDIHPDPSGPFTGDISAEMMADASARMVIVGHSDRRSAYGETDALVARKALAALRGGLEPIICVGETRAEREAGAALDVVRRQVRGSVPSGLAGSDFAVAYEPRWAIGSGRTPTLDQIEEVHRAIRDEMTRAFGERGLGVPILYGGSVQPSNATEILKGREIDGALVGRASLKAESLLLIARATG